MAKFHIFLGDGDNAPLPGQAVQLVLAAATSTVVASTNASDTGGVLTFTDNGDGSYSTSGTYSTYLSSGNLDTGTYSVKVAGTLVAELTWVSHIDPADILNALQADQNLGDLDDVPTAQANLELVPGVDVLAYSANAANAATWYGGWATAYGTGYPFPYWGASGPAFYGPEGMRGAIGLGDIATYNADQFLGAVVSTSGPPTASSVYVGRTWIRNSSAGNFGAWLCVRTEDDTYAWKLWRLDNGSGTPENAYYTW